MNKTEMNVKVVADDLGNVIRVSANNPDYGVIRVVEESIQFQNGWMRRKDKSALIPGFVEDLKTLNWKNGQKIAGQIVVKEALEPFNENDPDRDLKYAFAGGPLCVYEDQPIYRKTFFTLDMNQTDEYIQHTNVAEIREAINGKEVTEVKPVAKKESKVNTKLVEELVSESSDDEDVSFEF